MESVAQGILRVDGVVCALAFAEVLWYTEILGRLAQVCGSSLPMYTVLVLDLNRSLESNDKCN